MVETIKKINETLINAILKKAETICPDALELLGVYGSCATGDVHEKSDLDLLILIRDESGRKLAEGFLLDDVGIGYDLYCTTWEMLEEDARCNHAHLSKLMDSTVVYVKNSEVTDRLEALKKQAADTLHSEERYEKAQALLDEARKLYADCFLEDDLSLVRAKAGGVIHFLLDGVMLHHGRYFKKGVKRTFEELDDLNLPVDLKRFVLAVIRAEDLRTIREMLTNLMKAVQNILCREVQREQPAADNLGGSYEEMFSNWRNKMQEAAQKNDLFSSYMNMASLQFMLWEISGEVAVQNQNIMVEFSPLDLKKNGDLFDHALTTYLEEYKKAGMEPKRFQDVHDFVAYYQNRE